MTKETERKISNRGGARLGAGRKKAEGERHSYTKPSDVAKWIKDHGEGPYLTRVMRDIMSKA